MRERGMTIIHASDQFAHQDDGDQQSQNDAVAANESDALVAEAQADQTQGNSDAAAEANVQIAQANETSTIWNDIVGWASPTSGNPNGMPGLPWMQSQAGLAGAEAGWAVTAAANYQTYVAALGTAENNYATNNAAQFSNEIKTIDAADDTAANAQADTDLSLSTTLTGDEAGFEGTLALAGMNYQQEVGQTQHDYRQAVAQADQDLTVQTAENNPDAQANYAAAMAAAESAKTAANNQACDDYATLVTPTMTSQGTGDANAQEADSQTNAAGSLTDIQANNSAVDGYQDQESADYDTQQNADAVAESVRILADANGHAAAHCDRARLFW